MKTVLKVQASLFGSHGQSSSLADAFIEDVRRQHGKVRVITRELSAENMPALTLARFQAFGSKPAERTPEQQAIVDFSDALIAELKAADVVVLAVPMYNFTIPAALHNYFDHIARAGVTFRYTENGPEGLIKGKQAVVFVTRGGHYGEDHAQTAFLRQFLAFIGLNEVSFVHAEGLAVSEASREKSLATAREEIAKLAQPLSSAA